MSEYRIEKVRHPVAVTLDSGACIEGSLFLQSRARFRPGPEDPIDALNGDDRFLPLELASGDVLLVQKSHIAFVSTALPREDDAVDRAVLGMHVELTLTDGRAWSGSIFPEARADRTRLVDFLNDTPLAFIALFARDRLLAVSRRHVAFARAVA
jgi:hypothetical protein